MGFLPTWEQIVLPKAAKNIGDILHCTAFFTNIPLITILHDIIYMESSYLEIPIATASTYQKFGNVYRKLVATS
jgi:hypothetical protein